MYLADIHLKSEDKGQSASQRVLLGLNKEYIWNTKISKKLDRYQRDKLQT